ncbi:hypothetical protein Dimus_038969 [Dionaea muscipula]
MLWLLPLLPSLACTGLLVVVNPVTTAIPEVRESSRRSVQTETAPITWEGVSQMMNIMMDRFWRDVQTVSGEMSRLACPSRLLPWPPSRSGLQFLRSAESLLGKRGVSLCRSALALSRLPPRSSTFSTSRGRPPLNAASSSTTSSCWKTMMMKLTSSPTLPWRIRLGSRLLSRHRAQWRGLSPGTCSTFPFLQVSDCLTLSSMTVPPTRRTTLTALRSRY